MIRATEGRIDREVRTRMLRSYRTRARMALAAGKQTWRAMLSGEVPDGVLRSAHAIVKKLRSEAEALRSLAAKLQKGPLSYTTWKRARTS